MQCIVDSGRMGDIPSSLTAVLGSYQTGAKHDRELLNGESGSLNTFSDAQLMFVNTSI